MAEDNGGGNGMQTKEQAKYRNGNPIKHCGLCTHYQGGSCDVVEGDINPHMISNEYMPYPNPLKAQGLRFKLRGTEVWRQNRKARRQDTGKGTLHGPEKDDTRPPRPEPAAVRGGLQIGRKAY